MTRKWILTLSNGLVLRVVRSETKTRWTTDSGEWVKASGRRPDEASQRKRFNRDSWRYRNGSFVPDRVPANEAELAADPALVSAADALAAAEAEWRSLNEQRRALEERENAAGRRMSDARVAVTTELARLTPAAVRREDEP